MTGIAVFDVCGTLYATNTTNGFLSYFHAGQGSAGFESLRWTVESRSSPVFYPLAAVYRLTRVDVPRYLLLRSLAGVGEQVVEAAASGYVADVLPGLAIAETHARLRRHQSNGDRVVLLSNSIDPVVEAIARSLGVEWRASRLDRRHGVLSGRLALDMTGRKHVVLAELQHDAPMRSIVYTDNTTDRALVEAADQAVIVCESERLRHRWSGVDAEFVEL